MMETLNAVWTALTTTNEELINIFLFFLSFIDAYVVMTLFTTILNLEASRKQKIQYILLLSIIGFIIRIVFINPLATYLVMILTFILIFKIFKTTLLKSLIAVILPYAISILLEYIFSKIYYILFGTTWDTLLNIPIFRLTITGLIYITLYLMAKLCKRFKFNITLLDNMNKKSKIIVLTNCILAIIVIVSQFYLINFYSTNLPLLVTLLNIFSLIAYFVISFISFAKINQLEETEMNLQEIKLYNKTLTILHDNIRSFKHDFANIVSGIGGYVQTDDLEGLKKYYSQLLEDCQNTNNLSALTPELINNPAIYNVLATKYHKADEQGIKINLEVFLDLNTLKVKIYDFTRILGILMDNAIEATKECDEKVINLIIRNEQNKNRQIVIIENTYKNKDVNLDLIFDKGVTSKPGNTGLGLWKVREILKKNENLNLFTTKNDKYFKQQFEMYYTPKEG
ncbi:MAG TPA: hypothetical protein DCZ30_04390 [Clostridiales bacterium]|nr:hypothetical protein [Clostridiales bacterium]